MSETRKIAAILAADVVGFSRMASADEDRTLARLRALRANPTRPARQIWLCEFWRAAPNSQRRWATG
jgi:adenylate cyclase